MNPTPRISIQAVETIRVVVVDGWMDLKTAAAYMGVHPERLRFKAKANQIRHGKNGRQYKFRREWCDEYFEREQ